jgi:hypothetical protein
LIREKSLQHFLLIEESLVELFAVEKSGIGALRKYRSGQRANNEAQGYRCHSGRH